jgi:hypothetical protein
MPRITHVARAQQRYERVPVLDEHGQPKTTPVNRATKHGRPVTMAVTADDKTKPLDPYTCGYCRQPIAIGTPYKHISPKSGPYGGNTLRRHESCPSWQPWDYSNSLAAQISKIQYEFENVIADASDASYVESALSEAAEAAREIAEAKREAAQNIEDGFQHPTAQSEELAELADQLDDWANEIENVFVPDYPEPEEEDCPQECEEGKIDGETCETCKGDGTVTPEEPTEDQVDEWRSDVESETSVVGESPA